VATFNYSEALKKSGIVWGAEPLDQWLADPGKFVPDNDMAFRVESATERAEIIEFLRQQRP
jgi:cytochrome c